MAARSVRSVLSKRDYDAYTSDVLPGIAHPPRDTNDSVDDVVNDVADPIDFSSMDFGGWGAAYRFKGFARDTRAESSQNASSVVDSAGAERAGAERAGAEHPGMERMCFLRSFPVQFSVLFRRALLLGTCPSEFFQTLSIIHSQTQVTSAPSNCFFLISPSTIHPRLRTTPATDFLEALPPPAEPPVRIEEAGITSNDSSSDSSSDTISDNISEHASSCDLAASTEYYLEKALLARDRIRNYRAIVPPPPELAASGATGNSRSIYSAYIDSFDRFVAAYTSRSQNSTNESTTTPSSNQAATMSNRAAVPSNSRVIYQQLSSALKKLTHTEMDEPTEGTEGHQFEKLVRILKEQKTANLALYKATNNHLVLQLAWEATEKSFNRASIWGDWVFGAKLNTLPSRPAKLHRTFIDIEIKRISGDDQETIMACGAHPEFAFLGLLGYKRTSDDDSGVKTTSKRSSTSSTSTVAGLTSSTPGAWPGSVSRALITAQAVTAPTPAAAETEVDTSSAPGAWPAEPADDPPAAVSPSSTAVSDGSTTTLYSATSSGRPIISEAQRQANTAARSRLYDLMDANPDFEDLKANSAIYLVRVVGIPNPPEWATIETHPLRGPDFRRATLCGLGGWVVPNPSACRRTLPQHAIKLPAADVIKDWTFTHPHAIEGDFVPVWEGAEEPELEDVYHMVWDLVAGRDFVGLVPGHGFGRRRDGGFSFDGLRRDNPFQSQ
ncbi:hypothetical protein CONLIGDRAFT_473445 [Coniochaeta ligniaria NRRL 30616]|uniref:Uncharacterized protein n=1 Tax=Coniochaeta ligniaria NRRL 30616 TaxID=1408157 RepID=A0A1J7IGP8_9PEZI|nr:hypothetical protein CONLIGDRAFT_473445 [Coniochaeta ligniaria NRRL 30616]